MIPGKKAAHHATRFLILFMVCSLFFVACSRNPGDRSFLSSLTAIDSLISSGDTRSALKKLVSLRKKASSANDWLAIAKRERSLGDENQAADTLRAGLEQIPANIPLAAVLVDVLVSAGKFEEAGVFIERLSGTPYQSLAALSEIQRTRPSGCIGLDPEYWQWAYDATGNYYYLRNRSVLFAAAGNYAAACGFADPVSSPEKPVTLPPDEKIFRSILWYDSGNFDRARLMLETETVDQSNPDVLTVLADSAYRLKDIPAARHYWQKLIDRDTYFSPLPYYNLAITDTDAFSKASALETCLSIYPVYYPAVSAYVRSASTKKDEIKLDPVSAELAKAGFMSLEMEEQMRKALPDITRAQAVLDKALEKQGKKPASLFLVEKFRFESLQSVDSIRMTTAMWKLLEQFPRDPVLERYAVWYFTSIRNFDAAFSLNDGINDGNGAFYSGLQAVFVGDTEKALEEFGKVANDSTDSWAALANIARIHMKLEENEKAAEELAVAASLAPDARIGSRLHYEAARLYFRMNYKDRALTLARYAVDLDPGNYLADQFVRELEADY